jgi:hypothetical protein
VRSPAQSAGAGCNLRDHSFARPRRFSLAILNNLSGVLDLGRHCQSLSPIGDIFVLTSPKQIVQALWAHHLLKILQHNNNATVSSTKILPKLQVQTKINQNLDFCITVLIIEVLKTHPNHGANSDCAPSCIGFKGSKFDGTVEKLCSSDDSCWNLHAPSWFCQILQLMRRDLEPLCSTRIKRSPCWNKSSTPGIYNLGK